MRIKMRLIAITLIIVLSVSALAACGGTAPAEEPAEAEDLEGVNAVSAVTPPAIAENMSAQEFVESDDHWEWLDEYRDKTIESAEVKDGMDPYYQSIMEKILVPGDNETESGDENTVCSPLNMYIAFAMLAEVSDGNTRQQILDMLKVSDIESLRKTVTVLLDSNYVDTPVLKSLLANSLWLRNSVEYNEETLRRLAEQYCASSFSGEPGSDEMNEALRKWTDNNTGGLLSDYTKDMKLDKETLLAIVSTIYYKAAWNNTFMSQNNTQETFHGTSGDTTVDMMHMTDSMAVYSTDKFTAVGLGLSESGSMFFYLPNEGVNVNDLAADPDILNAMGYGDDSNWSFPEVHLSVPKFSVSGKTDLIETIKQLGITDALDPETADFSPITEDIDEIYLSAAEHAAMVEIDENGVTGAAYTELAMAEGTALPMEEIDFVIDRPFMFVITGADGSVLFSGIVRNI